MVAGRTDGESKIEGGQALQLPAWTWSVLRDQRSAQCGAWCGERGTTPFNVNVNVKTVIGDEDVGKASDVALTELWVVCNDPLRP